MTKPKFFRISRDEKILFAKQLALMLRSGLSLTEALEFLQTQNISPSLKYVLENLKEDLNKGQSLSSSLKKFYSQFGDLFINLVKVGEASGNLHQNLDYLALALKKEKELRGKIISMTIYPIFILTGTLLLTFLVVFIVFPKLLPVFTELKIKLPLTTKIFISFSSFLLNFWYFILLVILIFILGFILGLRNKKFRYFFDKTIIRFPFLKKIFRYLIFVNFTHNLSLLIRSGIEIITALEISGEASGNLFYEEIFLKIKGLVQEGHSLKEVFHLNEKYFDPVLINLLEVGEKSGELEATLKHLAEYYEDLLDATLKNFFTILEPLLLAFMGIIVAFIALAIISPIYQITQQIGK